MSAPSLPRPPGTAGRSPVVSAFLVLWLMVLTGICLTGDTACVRGLMRQSEAARFHQTPGTVARIDRLPQTDRRGRLYFVPRVTYAYEVAGQRYEGHNRRPGYDYFDDAWADAHRVGTPVTVLYNPADPADAALELGDSANQWMFLMGLLPLNAMMLAAWRVAFLAVTRRRPAQEPAPGLASDDRQGAPEIRTPACPPDRRAANAPAVMNDSPVSNARRLRRRVYCAVRKVIPLPRHTQGSPP